MNRTIPFQINYANFAPLLDKEVIANSEVFNDEYLKESTESAIDLRPEAME